MKSNLVTFSVIVPVYNIEKYLQRCVDSVLQGLSEDDEIILSLGDSLDSSTKIALDYARAYKNIHLVRQTGLGLSNARNCALRKANGTYIIYVDGDDYVKTDCFRETLEQIRHNNGIYDVYMLDYYRFDYRSGRYENQFIIPENTTLYGAEFLNVILSGRGCFWNVWRYIYKRAFLENNNLSFLENSLAEDIDYTTRILLAQPNIVFLHNPYYVYFVGREGSLMDRPTIKNLEDTVTVLKCSLQSVKASCAPFSRIVCSHYQYEYFLNLALLFEVPDSDRARGRMILADTKDVLSAVQDPTIKFAATFFRLFGLSLTAYVLHILKILRTKKKRLFALAAHAERNKKKPFV